VTRSPADPTAKHTPGPWTLYANSPDADGTEMLPSIMARNPLGDGLFYVAQANRDEDAELIASAPDLLAQRDALMATNAQLLAALKRAAPWLGKLIADDAHLNSVAPGDAIRTLEMVETAIAKAAPEVIS
jgi:hypothetical protein